MAEDGEAAVTPAAQALAALCRHEAALDATGNGFDRRQARRMAAIAAWIESLPGDPPIRPRDWPCPLCPASAGEPCELPSGRHHAGRGWRLAVTAPGERLLGEDPEGIAAAMCLPTLESGPAGASRGRCLGCLWRGPVRGAENEAVEDAHDHAKPGWRDLPIVEPPPPDAEKDPKRMAAWRARWGPLMPRNWLELAGPIRTYRAPFATRHVPGRAPGGGYDLSAGPKPEGEDGPAGITQEALF